MGAEKPYVVRREIAGREYAAQFNGLRAAVRCMDDCAAGDGVNLEKYMQYVLEHVIVEPNGLSMDDFADMETLSEVVRFGREVMQGRFRKAGEKPGEAAAESAGRLGRLAAGDERICLPDGVLGDAARGD